ncbi:MAG: hypothetical protein ACK4TC_18995 [Sphingomonas pseudosanguinis]
MGQDPEGFVEQEQPGHRRLISRGFGLVFVIALRKLWQAANDEVDGVDYMRRIAIVIEIEGVSSRLMSIAASVG